MGLDIREKRTNEKYPVGFDFSSELGASEEIASATVTVTSGLNTSGVPIIAANNTQVSHFIDGGTAGNYYGVTIKATTNAGSVLEHVFIIRVVTDTLPTTTGASALVRLDEVKSYIGKVTDEDDAVLERLIDSIAVQFNGYTDRNLASANYTNEIYDGNGLQVMYLRNYPITGNMAIAENDTTLTEGNESDYLCYNSTGELFRVNKTWYYGAKQIKVTYQAGYVCIGANITLPHDLRMAALEQIAYEFSHYQKKDWGLDSITYPDGSISRSQTGLLDSVKETLNRYRRFSI